MKKLLCCFGIFTLLASAAQALPVTDGLIIHLDARSLSLSDGAAVSQWNDIAKNDDIDGTVKTALNAALPTFNKAGYNGHPAVHFVEASKQALMSDTWSWTPEGVCIFLVCTGFKSDDDGRVVHVGSVTGEYNKTVHCDVSSQNTRLTDTGSGMRYENGWACTADAGPNPVRWRQWHTSVRQIAQGATYGSLVYAVNSFPALAVTTNAPTETMQFDSIDNVIAVGCGRRNATSGWVDTGWYEGDVAEIIVYNKQLTQAQMSETLTYLNTKYSSSMAHTPTPANNAVDAGTLVSLSDIDVTFGWSTGVDPNTGLVNQSIARHYLYINTTSDLSGVTPIVIPGGSPTQATASYTMTDAAFNTKYYWRVDESLLIGGLPTQPNDPNTIPGPLWALNSIRSYAVFTKQPANISAFPGENVQFTVQTSSISTPVTYQWYKTLALDGTVNNAIDLPVGTDSPTLPLNTIQGSDQGYYYCKATNLSGIPTLSNTARLVVKRKVAHYRLDTADFQNNQYLDSSGEGHHASPYAAPGVGSWVAGRDASTNQGLDISVNRLTGAKTANWAPASGTGEITISAWLYWHGHYQTPFYQGVITSRGTEGWNFLIEVRPSGELHINAQGDIDCNKTLPSGEWVHAVITANAASQHMYFNGQLVSTNAAPDSAFPQISTQLTLGVLDWGTGGPSQWYFNGVLDDVRIYNYAMTQSEVANMYPGLIDLPVCLTEDLGDSAQFDVAGPNGSGPDCKVNIADLSALAASWLNCGYYPYSGCE